jgi:hypothetical protein
MPNPATTVAHAVLSGSRAGGEIAATVVDVAGRRVTAPVRASGDRLAVDVRGLPAGVYWLSVEGADGFRARGRVNVVR